MLGLPTVAGGHIFHVPKVAKNTTCTIFGSWYGTFVCWSGAVSEMLYVVQVLCVNVLIVYHPSSTTRLPACLWVIGMAVCGDKDMAALATIRSQNSQVYGRFVWL